MSGKHQPADFIQHFALQLRNADPAAYQSFLEAIDAYATEITVAVTEAPAADILNLQGRARQTLIFTALLRNPRAITASPPPQQAAP